eukprot:453769-Amphidinium_carterae.1
MYALLSATKSQGFIGPSTARKLAQEWELVPGELATSSRGEGADILLATYVVLCSCSDGSSEHVAMHTTQ